MQRHDGSIRVVQCPIQIRQVVLRIGDQPFVVKLLRRRQLAMDVVERDRELADLCVDAGDAIQHIG